MKKIILIFAAIAIVGCGNKRQELTHEGARTAAEHFYSLLINNDSEAYVDGLAGMVSCDSLTRAEMIDVVSQFVKRELDAHNSIASATAVRDTIYADSLAQVFMDVVYGDSTMEHIMLPLVYTGGEWKMR
jgi:hypothetical protein